MRQANRPFPSCFEPHYESEAKCKVFVMKISFHSYANKTNMKSFSLSLPFIARFTATRKWPIKHQLRLCVIIYIIWIFFLFAGTDFVWFFTMTWIPLIVSTFCLFTLANGNSISIILIQKWFAFNLPSHSYEHRGYYMTARRYEISLRVLKNISRVSAANEWNIVQDEINTNEIPNHCKRRDLLCNLSNGDLFTYEDNFIFTCEDIMFSRERSPHLAFHISLFS